MMRNSHYVLIEGSLMDVAKFAMPPKLAEAYSTKPLSSPVSDLKADLPRVWVFANASQRVTRYLSDSKELPLGFSTDYVQGSLDNRIFTEYYNLQVLNKRFPKNLLEYQRGSEFDISAMVQIQAEAKNASVCFSFCYVDDAGDLSAFSLRYAKTYDHHYVFNIAIVKNIENATEEKKAVFISHADLLLNTDKITRQNAKTCPQEKIAFIVREKLNSAKLYQLLVPCLSANLDAFKCIETLQNAKLPQGGRGELDPERLRKVMPLFRNLNEINKRIESKEEVLDNFAESEKINNDLQANLDGFVINNIDEKTFIENCRKILDISRLGASLVKAYKNSIIWLKINSFEEGKGDQPLKKMLPLFDKINEMKIQVKEFEQVGDRSGARIMTKIHKGLEKSLIDYLYGVLNEEAFKRSCIEVIKSTPFERNRIIKNICLNFLIMLSTVFIAGFVNCAVTGNFFFSFDTPATKKTEEYKENMESVFEAKR